MQPESRWGGWKLGVRLLGGMRLARRGLRGGASCSVAALLLHIVQYRVVLHGSLCRDCCLQELVQLLCGYLTGIADFGSVYCRLSDPSPVVALYGYAAS